MQPTPKSGVADLRRSASRKKDFDMQNSLEQLITRLSKKSQNLLNSVEEATKQGAVLPILSSLGWDCFNVEEVSPEFSVGNGRVDYCLRLNQKKSVFIEVKRATEELERHEKQLLEYAFEYGVKIAILTNGLTWWFYLPLMDGTWQQRKFFSIDIRQQKPGAASKHFQEFLSRESFVDGSAIKKAISVKEGREKNKSIKEAIPKAWKQLLEEPDGLLLELLADKVESICGHSPDPEILTTFIHQINISNQSPTQLLIPSKTRPKRQTTFDHSANTVTKTSSRQKGASITIGDKNITAGTVGDLYLQSLKFLCDNQYISKIENKIPFATSSVRYLIAHEPIHQRGNKFRIPIEYNGYYMEAHKNYESALKQLEDFVKECGLTMKY